MRHDIWARLFSYLSPAPSKDRIAVFIDCDGVSPKDAERALGIVRRYGSVIMLRAFGNYVGKAASGWTRFLRGNNGEARHLPSLTPGKNASDIALTVDAIEVLLTKPIDIFVLIASDSDFTPLSRRLRSEGKVVLGFGHQSAPAVLREACDRFWDLQSLAGDLKPSKPSRALWSLSPHDAEAIIVGALRELVPEGELVPISRLSKTLKLSDPEFDPRIYRRRTLSSLLKELSLVELVDKQGSLVVRLRNGRD